MDYILDPIIPYCIKSTGREECVCVNPKGSLFLSGKIKGNIDPPLGRLSGLIIKTHRQKAPMIA